MQRVQAPPPHHKRLLGALIPPPPTSRPNPVAARIVVIKNGVFVAPPRSTDPEPRSAG